MLQGGFPVTLLLSILEIHIVLIWLKRCVYIYTYIIYNHIFLFSFTWIFAWKIHGKKLRLLRSSSSKSSSHSICHGWGCAALVSFPYFSRWWFQIFFIFTAIWGRFPFWLIFQMGWNHQLVLVNLRKFLPFFWVVLESVQHFYAFSAFCRREVSPSQ